MPIEIIRDIIAKARADAVTKEPVTVVELLLVLNEIEKVLPKKLTHEFEKGDTVEHVVHGQGTVTQCGGGIIWIQFA